MKFRTILSVFIVVAFSAPLLVGQSLGEQPSIRLKGHLDKDGVKYPFTLLRDPHGRIVATISDQNDRRELKIYWDGEDVFKEQTLTQLENPSSVTTTVGSEKHKFAPSFSVESNIEETVFPSQDHQVRSIDKISGEESVVLLFDLLATSMSSNFKEKDNFQLEHSIFANYSLELDWNDDLKIKGHDGKAPRRLRLFKKVDTEPVELIREFNYKSFHQLKSGTVYPKEMTYSGLNENGVIFIRNVTLNPGVPDFLFDPIRNIEN